MVNKYENFTLNMLTYNINYDFEYIGNLVPALLIFSFYLIKTFVLFKIRLLRPF